jgi:signal transduction histidine kinase
MPISLRRAQLRPRSIRGRITALVALLAVLLLVPGGVLGAVVARHAIADQEWREARRQVAITAADIRAGRLRNPVVPRVVGADLVQVVVPGHRVIASSAAARGMPPMSTAWPGPQEPRRDVQTCVEPEVGCVRLSVVRVRPTADSPVVYAGRRAPSRLSTGIFDGIFAVQVAALIVLAAWAAWTVTGRTLKPVEAIRAELAAMNFNDLSGRVLEPDRQIEIARLARTINDTLGRLEQAKRGMERTLDRQRQFAADASHELRTPIAGLRTRLEEAQLYPDDIDQPAMLEEALRDIDRLEAIATDLLLLTRLGTNMTDAMETIDLAELVKAQVAKRGDPHPVQLQLEPGVLVNAVRVQISRVLANLLDNAQRHAKSTVITAVQRVNGQAELAVDDDGDGVAEPDHERIFQRFTRLDPARSRDRGGTGLGLAIASDIARVHHGTLHIEDSRCGGARFVLHLPLWTSGDTDPESTDPDVAAPQ